MARQESGGLQGPQLEWHELPPLKRMREQGMHRGYAPDLRNPDQNMFWTEIRIANEMKWNTRIKVINLNKA